MDQNAQKRQHDFVSTNLSMRDTVHEVTSLQHENLEFQKDTIESNILQYFGDRFKQMKSKPVKLNLRKSDEIMIKMFNWNKLKRENDRQISFVSFKNNYWTAFTISFLISFADSLDFYTMAFSIHKIANYYQTSKANMSQAITYSILQRTLGGLFSASFGSSFGQKYMIILDMILLGSLQIAATFCKNVNLFLIIRALFGLGMSSVFSLASLHLIKNSPQNKRTFVGALYQCSAPLAALLSAGLNIIFHEQDDSWRKMFWTSASISYACAIVRFIIPECKTIQAHEIVAGTEEFIISFEPQTWRSKLRNARMNTINKPWNQIKSMLSMHWRIFFYGTILMGISTWYSHSINDTYVTFLIFSKNQQNRMASIIVMIIKSTSIPAIVLSGALAQLFGIRRIAIPFGLIAMTLIPAAFLPFSSSGLALGGAFFNFFTEAFLALFPSYIDNHSPSQFNIFLPAMAFHLGSCFSSPSSQIINVLGQNLHFIRKGQRIPAYQHVILTTALITIFFTIFWFYLGPKDDNHENAPTTEQETASSGQSAITAAIDHLELPQTALNTSSHLISQN